MYPCADDQTDQQYQREQYCLLSGPERVENGDGQIGPPCCAPKSARISRKLQILLTNLHTVSQY